MSDAPVLLLPKAPNPHADGFLHVGSRQCQSDAESQLAKTMKMPVARAPMLVRHALIVLVIAVGLVPLLARAGQQTDIYTELMRLSSTEGFAVSGAQMLEGAQGWIEEGDVYSRLQGLLEGVDHIIVQGEEGNVLRVIILGNDVDQAGSDPLGATGATGSGDDAAKLDEDDGRIVLKTRRKGKQHLATVSLESKSGRRIQRTLLIDTGASSVVLPSSLIGQLGLVSRKLEQLEVQTANGKTNARVARLPAIWLGSQRIESIDVAFIADHKLGSAGLLGMGVLGQYQLTIDNDADLLILSPTQPPAETTE